MTCGRQRPSKRVRHAIDRRDVDFAARELREALGVPPLTLTDPKKRPSRGQRRDQPRSAL